MSSHRTHEPVHIGLFSSEPIRLAGLASVFEPLAKEGKPLLLPVTGTLEELLAHATLQYLVVDLQSTPGGLKALDSIRRARPSLRLIVIGPEGDEELILDSIIAGARAYLDLRAAPDMVRMAIEVVIAGSIWAPRHLLSRLIDRLLNVPDSSLTNQTHQLTDREQQVLELILLAQSNREIAHELGIEERTVKAHVGRLMRKTGAENRIELSLRALRQPLSSHAHGGRERRSKTSDEGVTD
jgi:DNA-binding NarL/FixJ family response regulator